MCGFVGFISTKSSNDEFRYLQSMSETLVHRGPDSNGEWSDREKGIYLAHRRLSIQDLSPLGHQPMESASGRYVIIFNGEIYNFKDLKSSLENNGHVFNGHSDTEVMLHAFEEWGLESSLKKFHGMFAFALWDKKESLLFLARDRLGEKPLYFGWQKDTFLFGSELKALRRHPDWENTINRDSLPLYMRHNFIPAPYSIYKDIYKLTPGSYLSLKPTDKNWKTFTYWSPKEVFEEGMSHPLTTDKNDIVDELENKLKTVIDRQLIADVPVGAFLSGGVDSSTVVALAQEISEKKVNTFTIGFDIEGYNEAEHAKKISSILGTNHTELYVTPADALNVIPELPSLYDEPFADSSQIPTYLVSQLARESVTVALSGDGGDELFSGYDRYRKIYHHWQKNKHQNSVFKNITRKLLQRTSPETLDKIFGSPVNLLSSKKRNDIGLRIFTRLTNASQSSLQSRYQEGISYWNEFGIIKNMEEPLYNYNNPDIIPDTEEDIKLLQYLDMLVYLPDDILAKVDRAGMAHSLETRIPLLDHDIVEYALKIPSELNYYHKDGKWPLRQILQKYVPQEIIERPKMGFAVPVAHWLKDELRDWAESLLERNKLADLDIFNPDKLHSIWAKHQSGDNDYSFQLWAILMFLSWHDSNERHVRNE